MYSEQQLNLSTEISNQGWDIKGKYVNKKVFAPLK